MNQEQRMFNDELIAFRNGGVANIQCQYSRSKLDKFIAMIQHYKYKIKWTGECAVIRKEQK